MVGRGHPVRTVLLGVWSLVLFSFTIVLSGGPLLVLRRTLGALPYWLLGCGMTLVFWGSELYPFAILFGSVMALVDSFYEFNQLGESLKASSAYSLIIGSGAGLFVFSAWALKMGEGWYGVLLRGVDSTLESVKSTLAMGESGMTLPVSTHEVLIQAPSALLLVLLMTLFLALLLERPLSSWLNLEEVTDWKLHEFRLPDFVIWCFIASLLGTFLKTELTWIQNVSANVFNVALMLYFFQGLAVTMSFFKKMQVGWIWQSLFIVFLFLSRGFLLISVIGLMDYWVDFRARFLKKAPGSQHQER